MLNADLKRIEIQAALRPQREINLNEKGTHYVAK